MATGGPFPGRLELAKSRVPHADRHGLVWLSRGTRRVEDGTLRFLAAESDQITAGDYAIPYRRLSMILLGPGSIVSHDALRLLARHGTLLAAVGALPPLGFIHEDSSNAFVLDIADLWRADITVPLVF